MRNLNTECVIAEPKRIPIQYPLQIVEVHVLKSQNIGQISKVKIDLKNISNRDITNRIAFLNILAGGG